jgi:hypothetical protein
MLLAGRQNAQGWMNLTDMHPVHPVIMKRVHPR